MQKGKCNCVTLPHALKVRKKGIKAKPHLVPNLRTQTPRLEEPLQEEELRRRLMLRLTPLQADLPSARLVGNFTQRETVSMRITRTPTSPDRIGWTQQSGKRGSAQDIRPFVPNTASMEIHITHPMHLQRPLTRRLTARTKVREAAVRRVRFRVENAPLTAPTTEEERNQREVRVVLVRVVPTLSRRSHLCWRC